MIQGKYLYFTDDLSELIKIREKVLHNKEYYPKNTDKNNMDESSVHAVVYADDRPVATGRVHSEKQVYYIDEIAVLEEEQGKGYGDFIVRMLIDKAFILGSEEVVVYSPPELELFFKKIGFRIYGNDINNNEHVFIKLKICQEDLLKKCRKQG
ncbi:hypothetical protein EDD66_11618 [Mobilisporobacter senegalensis]|uniref:N-acetyltransferase domain-containing protein n=1 Tax=Mobilisporobacter senegalensis TaxID=1329262 RepID=A0A3N1X829_9FIRM|nr:GNAT family N-acetyltransferase [Mobilisporobacter senegalensis]ROR22138.1 hypothetical protein EDD66_11618 [Mobilisporobacter senegalensis]